MTPAENRLQDLETALAHQEQQIRDLSEMVNTQWREIDRLKLRLDATLRKLSDIEAAGTNPGSDKAMTTAEIAASEKPPHY